MNCENCFYFIDGECVCDQTMVYCEIAPCCLFPEYSEEN